MPHTVLFLSIGLSLGSAGPQPMIITRDTVLEKAATRRHGLVI